MCFRIVAESALMPRRLHGSIGAMEEKHHNPERLRTDRVTFLLYLTDLLYCLLRRIFFVPFQALRPSSATSGLLFHFAVHERRPLQPEAAGPTFVGGTRFLSCGAALSRAQVAPTGVHQRSRRCGIMRVCSRPALRHVNVYFAE
jgi:hypothetical protein